LEIKQLNLMSNCNVGVTRFWRSHYELRRNCFFTYFELYAIVVLREFGVKKVNRLGIENLLSDNIMI